MKPLPLDLRSLSYQVYGACGIDEAKRRYQERFGRAPQLIVAHPKQAEGTEARPAGWCMCSQTAGQGPWYTWPSRKELEG